MENSDDILMEIIEDNGPIIPKQTVDRDKKISIDEERLFETSHWYFKYRIEVLKRLLKGNLIGKNLNILDVGVGTGTISKEIEKYGNVTHIESELDIIKNNPDLTILKGVLPWDLNIENDYYDYVVLFNILEYLVNDMWALDVLKTKIKDNGKILIVVPAGKNNYDLNDKFYDIKKRYDLKEFEKELITLGLKIEDYTYFENHSTTKQFSEYTNKLFDEQTIYWNEIPKDNDEIYEYLKSKEFDKVGINRLKSGKQLFLKISKMTKEEKNKINAMYEKENKTKLIDIVIDKVSKDKRGRI